MGVGQLRVYAVQGKTKMHREGRAKTDIVRMSITVGWMVLCRK